MDVYADGGAGLDIVSSMSPDAYAAAEPFPHAVFRGVFDESLLDAVVAEFPDVASMGTQFEAADEVKSAENRWERFGPATQTLLAALNSAPFVDALERLTGVDGLITDHHFRGGGQHQIRRGGHLGVHADFNTHLKLGLARRLNVLVYLNRDWRDDWGGHLELWDTQMTRAVVTVRPDFNTMVVFSTTSESFHGHPDPLTCPEGTTRRSIATYYYSALPTDHVPDQHSTLFQDRPGVPPRTSNRDKAMQRFRAGTRQYRQGLGLLLPDGVKERIRRLRGS
jgi:hypothetical protein